MASLTHLLRDPLHREVEPLGFAPSDQRRFPDWGVGYVPTAGQHEALVRRVCLGVRSLPATSPLQA